jgi:hypothetical protein
MFDQRTRLEGIALFTRDPFLGFGGYDALPVIESFALANPANGLTSGLSRSVTGIGALTHEWSRRARTAVTYDYTRREYLRGPGFDGHSQSAQASYEQNLSQVWIWRASYRFANAVLYEPTRIRPIRDDAIESGFTYTRNLSRTRRLSYGATVGATYVQTTSSLTDLPLEYWTPSGSGTVRLDFNRSWFFSADFRRGLAVLDGLTTEAFITDAVVLHVGGHVNSRTDLAFATGYANGRTGDAFTSGDYGTYTGTAQVRVGIARWAAFVANYNYFNYELGGLTFAPGAGLTTIPSSFDRHAVRFGLSLWLPLFGGFVEQPTDRIGDF